MESAVRQLQYSDLVCSQNIALDVVNPDCIDVRLQDIGGLADTIQSLVRYHYICFLMPCSMQCHVNQAPSLTLQYTSGREIGSLRRCSSPPCSAAGCSVCPGASCCMGHQGLAKPCLLRCACEAVCLSSPDTIRQALPVAFDCVQQA